MVSRSLVADVFDQDRFSARTPTDIERRRALIARIGRLSDNIVGFGPFGIGIEGVLAWVPVLGQVYSLAAGGLLLFEGYRARVPRVVLAKVALIVLLRTGIDTGAFIPGVDIVTSLIVDLFRGHRWAANMLVKAIDETLYLEGPYNPASPAYLEAMARIRRGGEKRRVVFLG